MRRFSHFVAIDWSGANVARPTGIAVAVARPGRTAPALVRRAGGWSREAILAELLRLADAGRDALIGIDLSPGLPFADAGAFFPGWAESPPDAKCLWALVDALSADDPHLGAGGFVAHAEAARFFRHQTGAGDRFTGGRGRLRATEAAQRALKLSPSSCFNLVGAAQVGKASLTGMRVLHRLAGRVPAWPFDPLSAAGPVIVEIYTSLAARAAGLRAGRSKLRDALALDAALAALDSRPHTPLPRYDDHSTDAMLTAAWLRSAANDPALWKPAGLTGQIAATEGWTFGVP